MCKLRFVGPWLWRSWQSGRFRHQRSAVRIPTSAINYFECISVNCFPEKTKIKKKRLGMAQFKKKLRFVYYQDVNKWLKSFKFCQNITVANARDESIDTSYTSS